MFIAISLLFFLDITLGISAEYALIAQLQVSCHLLFSIVVMFYVQDSSFLTSVIFLLYNANLQVISSRLIKTAGALEQVEV